MCSCFPSSRTSAASACIWLNSVLLAMCIVYFFLPIGDSTDAQTYASANFVTIAGAVIGLAAGILVCLLGAVPIVNIIGMVLALVSAIIYAVVAVLYLLGVLAVIAAAAGVTVWWWIWTILRLLFAVTIAVDHCFLAYYAFKECKVGGGESEPLYAKP